MTTKHVPSRSDTSVDTLADTLRHRTRYDTDLTAYEFLDSSNGVTVLSYGELGRRALTTAAALRQRVGGRPGREPVLILQPPGIDYLVALWACLAAGTPAVPAYPPTGRASDRSLERLRGLVGDSNARWVFASGEAAALLPAISTSLEPVSVAESTGLDGPRDPSWEQWEMPGPDDIAIIQYTSGSTRTPRGVALSHRNLAHNIAAIAELFELDHTSRAFVWLPPYHDMGLVGGILTPFHVGFPVRLMSPLAFLKNPALWLRQISDSGATVSGGPDFAYGLTMKRFRNDPAASLDLSKWRVAFNGAEPIRPATLAAFTRRFRPAGFDGSAFLPCYGLAEATLLVSGRHWDPSAETANTAVSCGPPVRDHEVAVVDPDTGEPRPEGAEGEIWVRGPSVAGGYWRGADGAPDTGAMGYLSGRRYLRTGDIGVLAAGELFVHGRMTDVLVCRGVNYHAADIEHAATDRSPDVRPMAAAFLVPRQDADPFVVLVVERARQVDRTEVAAALRARVLDTVGLRLDVIVVAELRAIPRTSSGKVQRGKCRERYLAGDFDGWIGLAPPQTDDVTAFLAGVFAVVCGIDECGPDVALTSIGGDSLKAAEIAGIVEDATGLPAPVEAILAGSTPRAVADRLVSSWSAHGMTTQAVLDHVRAQIPVVAR